MKTFTGIFRNWETITTATGTYAVKGVVEKQAEDRIAVEQLLAELGVKRREPDAPIPPSDDQILLRIATWNGMDMQFLDRLTEGAARERLLEVLELFFVDDAWQSQEQLDRYIPGMNLRTVHQTPLVGFWQHSRLVECASGVHGYRLVLEYFGLPTDHLRPGKRLAL